MIAEYAKDIEEHCRAIAEMTTLDIRLRDQDHRLARAEAAQAEIAATIRELSRALSSRDGSSERARCRLSLALVALDRAVAGSG